VDLVSAWTRKSPACGVVVTTEGRRSRGATTGFDLRGEDVDHRDDGQALLRLRGKGLLVVDPMCDTYCISLWRHVMTDLLEEKMDDDLGEIIIVWIVVTMRTLQYGFR